MSVDTRHSDVGSLQGGPAVAAFGGVGGPFRVTWQLRISASTLSGMDCNFSARSSMVGPSMLRFQLCRCPPGLEQILQDFLGFFGDSGDDALAAYPTCLSRANLAEIQPIRLSLHSLYPLKLHSQRRT